MRKKGTFWVAGHRRSGGVAVLFAAWAPGWVPPMTRAGGGQIYRAGGKARGGERGTARQTQLTCLHKAGYDGRWQGGQAISIIIIIIHCIAYRVSRIVRDQKSGTRFLGTRVWYRVCVYGGTEFTYIGLSSMRYPPIYLEN